MSTNPFDAVSGLQAHRSFVQAAHGVGVRKVSVEDCAGVGVGQASQGCKALNIEALRAPGVEEVGASAERTAAELPRERTRLECPHCDAPCVIRSSRRMTKLTREYAYCCTNYECGHTFVALMEIHRTVSPSATPDPSVDLPLSTHVRRDLLRVQMDSARSAFHPTELTKPVTGDLFASGQPPPT